MGKLFKNKEKDLTKERSKELIPVARGIVKLIVDADLNIGDQHKDDATRYDNVTKQILELMLEKNVKYVDKDFLFQLVLQPFDIIKESVQLSLRKSFDRAIDKSLGKEFREVRLDDLDKILR